VFGIGLAAAAVLALLVVLDIFDAPELRIVYVRC
jgi:presenilin-like A22 family membrane protease